MKKIGISFRVNFSIDNTPVFDSDVFSIIIDLSKLNKNGKHFIAVNSFENEIICFGSFETQLIDSSIKDTENMKK